MRTYIVAAVCPSIPRKWASCRRPRLNYPPFSPCTYDRASLQYVCIAMAV